MTFQIFPLPSSGPPQRQEALLRGQIGLSAPRRPWDKFLRLDFRWLNGEHVGLIGPTGQGKTTMLKALLPLHRYTTVFATKPADEEMQDLIKNHGYELYEKWPRGLDPKESPRRVIWPDATKIDSDELQRQVFSDAFARIYREGAWTLAIDELWWFDQVLNLSKPIKTYLLQARSLKISLLAATQRPAWVPREIYSACTHLFIWRTSDQTDLMSLSGIGASDARLIREVVANLDRFEALYINTRTGRMIRTKVQR